MQRSSADGDGGAIPGTTFSSLESLVTAAFSFVSGPQATQVRAFVFNTDYNTPASIFSSPDSLRFAAIGHFIDTCFRSQPADESDASAFFDSEITTQYALFPSFRCGNLHGGAFVKRFTVASSNAYKSDETGENNTDTYLPVDGFW